MVRWQEKPGGFSCYYMDGAATRDGAPIERGYYVPIDYDKLTRQFYRKKRGHVDSLSISNV